MKKRYYLLAFPIFLVTLFFTGCQSTTEGKQDETERLNEWFDVKYEEKIQMSPMQLTMLGRKELYDQLDDMSEEADERQLEWMRQTVNELKEKFDYEALDAEGKVSYDLWVYQYEMANAGKEYIRHSYVFDQMRSVHTQLPTFLLNFHKVEDAKDMKAYISRIEAVGVAAKQLLERARIQVKEGIRPPAFAYEIVITQAQSLLQGAPFTEGESHAPIWGDILSKVDALQETGEIDANEADALKQDAAKALQNHFKPAYEEVISFIKTDLEQAEATPVGVSRHPNGEAFYNYMLKAYTTTDLTADEIHNIGLAEVERIHKEMRLIMEEVGFEGSMKEFFVFTNTDERFFYPNTDEGREGYLQDSREFLDGINERLPEFFGILPKAGLEVRRVESFREQDGAPQHYMPGTPDGSRDGVYYAHLSDMGSMPKTTMEAIAYHEGNPGHHMQISIAQELETVPEFRTQERATAYVEGWALYSEKLAKEMGGYQDPYSDFGRLTAEIWRAIRLVVDTGLHAKGWTEADAVNYFMENSPIAEGAIKAEVRRYMVMPGQATAYKIGMIKIEELRAKAEETLGDRFDIKDFHDTLLGSGSMPLQILEDHVNHWIAGYEE